MQGIPVRWPTHCTLPPTAPGAGVDTDPDPDADSGPACGAGGTNWYSRRLFPDASDRDEGEDARLMTYRGSVECTSRVIGVKGGGI